MEPARTSRRRPRRVSQAPSSALVLLAIGSVQLGSALAATLFARVGPSGAVLLRMASAAVILLALIRPHIARRSKPELLLAAVFGLVLAAMNLTFYEAIARIPLGIAVSVEFIGPLAVALAGSRRRIDLVWVALAVGGIVALTRGSVHHLSVLGLGLALTAGCFWGAYILLNARLGRAYEGASGLALAIGVATVAMLPVGIAAAGHHLLDAESLTVGPAVGLLSSAIPYTLEIEALRRIAPPVFGVLMSLEPAAAALAGFLVLGQGLAARTLLGIALVIAASVGASTRATRPPVAVQ